MNAAGFIADLTDHGQAAASLPPRWRYGWAVDMLVNNAGIAQIGEQSAPVPFVELTERQWDRDLARQPEDRVQRPRGLCFRAWSSAARAGW